MFIQFLSVKIWEKIFLKIKTKRQSKTLTTIPTIMQEETKLATAFLSDFTLYDAVILEIISVKPLETIVRKTMKTERTTWYIPSASAPIVLERKILKTKPNSLVKTEKKVMIATFLTIDFI